MSTLLRWGILGTGRIAGTFTQALDGLGDAAAVAVGSRTAAGAAAFGARHGIEHCHGSYEALVADPDVDVVYVATPHPMHKENCILALRAGKAVLCEKPFTMNAAEAREVVAVARETGGFLMDGMWTRFVPTVVQAREWLTSGAIGDPRLVQADFGFRAEVAPESRLFAPALGGGALLDVGIYVVSLASMVFGGPTVRAVGLTNLCETGVDEQSAMVLGYPGGGMAVLSCAVRTRTTQTAKIHGTEGTIHLHRPFWSGTKVTLEREGQEPETRTFDMPASGFAFEADEVARCLAAGMTESEIMPLDESVAIMETLDALRAQWGLRYPME